MDLSQKKAAAKSYKQILKPTFIMGGSSIITTLIGIIRTKFLAVILGPSGVGLAGIYMSSTNLVRYIAELGIGDSGIRQIAEASGADDNKKISRTALCVRRTAFLSGIVGSAFLLISCNYLSRWTFGDSTHSFDFIILSAALFLEIVSDGQIALIRGMRRIADLAKLSIVGALLGTVLSIPVIYFIGERGITFYIFAVSATGIIASWWYSRKIEVDKAKVVWRDSFAEARPLLKLGLAFMLVALLVEGSQYLLRVLIIRHSGLGAAGVYQASTTLSSVYVGIILRAMTTDYYPRLTAAANDIKERNSLINKQIEVGLLLAAPVVLATITLAPLVIVIFYSPRFMSAVAILRWQILGVLLQVCTLPIGFILRAKGSGKLLFWTELFSYITLLSLAWVGMSHFGLPGIGMAFFGMNLLYGILIFGIARRTYGFVFSTRNVQISSIFFAATVFAFATSVFLSEASYIINIVITCAVGLFSIKTLFGGMEIAPSFMLRIKSLFSNP